MEEVAADGVNALGAAIAKGGALVDEGLAKIGAKKIDPVTGKYVDVDWLETPLNPTFLDDVRKRFQQGVNLFKTNRKIYDNKILILGCGAIGMLLSSLLNSMGIKDITILDKINDRLLYANKYFKAKKLIKQDLNKNIDPENNNYNYVFDLITNNQSFDYGIKAINKSGKYIVIGIPETEDFIKINPHKLRIKEIDILNIRRSNVKFNRMQEIIVNRSIPIDKLITHYFKIEDIQKGFDMASSYSKKIIRGIVY